MMHGQKNIKLNQLCIVVKRCKSNLDFCAFRRKRFSEVATVLCGVECQTKWRRVRWRRCGNIGRDEI